jgi:hypothetical protein
MYHTTAKGLAALGRNGDSTLMHVNPNELAGLQKLLGPLSNNPDTGLPEAFAWGPIMGMLGGVATSAVDLGLGGAMHEPVKELIGNRFGDTVQDVAGVVAPAVTSGLLNAGVNYLMGGKEAALGGFAQGAMMGGLGAMDTEALFEGTGDAASRAPKGQDFFEQVGSNFGKLGDKYGSVSGLKSLAKNYGSPGFLASLAGSGLTQEAYDQQAADELQNNFAFGRYQKQQNAGNLARSIYGFAAGGPLTIDAGTAYPVSMTIPGEQVEEIAEMGGVGGLMQHLKGMSTGGYINTQPVNPEEFYPQSQIAKARPYPAASPQRHEVVQGYEDGGFLDGPGDGQSDSIPASIEGKEPIKVADGEFVVPKHIVDMIGVDALDKLLTDVRKASFGTSEQSPRDAGKLAAQRLLARHA